MTNSTTNWYDDDCDDKPWIRVLDQPIVIQLRPLTPITKSAAHIDRAKMVREALVGAALASVVVGAAFIATLLA